MPTASLISPARPLPTLSAEVKSILDTPPAWLVRWGSMLLLSSILVLFCAMGLVRYPHAITGQAALYVGTQLTKIELPVGTTHYVLHVQPRQPVQAGQLLAIAQQGGIERALTAPLAGTVIVPDRPAGRVLLQLLPTAQAQRSTITLPARLSSQVHVGQRVLVSLAGFPSEKFGQLSGHVTSEVQASGPDQATATIVLDQGYRTTHGTLLPLTGASQGTVQVITTDKRLLSLVLKNWI